MGHKTESSVVLGYTRGWFENSQWSVERFANELLAPALERDGQIDPMPAPASGDEYIRARRAWGVRVGRIFNGTQPFPLEWKWTWLSCLPDDHYQAARAELLAIAGVLDIRLPTPSTNAPRATVARLGDVMREVGEFIAACQPAHDGAYHRDDDPEAVERMFKEGLEAMEHVASELVALSQGTGRPLPRNALKYAVELMDASAELVRQEGDRHA